MPELCHHPGSSSMVKTKEELKQEVVAVLEGVLHDVCSPEAVRDYADEWVERGYDAADLKGADEARLQRGGGMLEGHAFKVHTHFLTAGKQTVLACAIRRWPAGARSVLRGQVQCRSIGKWR